VCIARADIPMLAVEFPTTQVRGRGPDRRGRGESSYGEKLFADEMQTNHLRGLAFVEVALHGVPNLRMELGQGVCLGEDGPILSSV
jgi:hypothetical protein